jgi:hypothetical protein
MLASVRLVVCARCRAQAIFCRRCDRGQIYCNNDCTELSRQFSMREAGRRYQRSRHGRFSHAERMRRYRSRQNKVTHHGSVMPAADALLIPTSTTSAATASVSIAAAPVLEHSGNASVRASYASGHFAIGSSMMFAFLRITRDMTHDHWNELEAQMLCYYHVEKWRCGTVQRVLAQAGLPRIGTVQRPSQIDAYLPFILETLKKFPAQTASRLCAMVYERGCRGGQHCFRHLISLHRPRPVAGAYLRLRSLPGEQAQCEWGVVRGKANIS